MKKVWGILGLLVFIGALTALLSPHFLDRGNLQNIFHWTSLHAILAIGVAFVIISGGIDLSIGSVVGLVGTMLAWLLTVKGAGVAVSVGVVLVLSAAIGLGHGLLVTKLKIQPFVVTLCGLLVYRGLARYVSGDQTLGFGSGYADLKYLSSGKLFGVPMPFVIMAVLALAAAVLLNRTVWGRYLLALGRNEQAARYSGIDTDRMTILAYVICSLLAGLGGMLFALDLNSVQPSGLGEFYELYAIAAAVLGGCSLRGGEGGILGVLIGAAVMRVLYNAINILGIPTHLEFAIIGVVIMGGVIADEVVRRIVARRRAAASSSGDAPGP
jgi:ribose transport system permease protein